MNRYYPEGMLIKRLENQEYISTQKGLEKALERQVILEAPVVLCDHNFNLHVSLGERMRGIIPRCEVEYGKGEVKDIAILTRVGKCVCFIVQGFKKEPSGEIVAILSRRMAQKECIENYISTLTPGDVIQSKITHIENFGAFVDVGCGIISLLSIDSISVSRITHPAERLSVGENIYCVIKSIDDTGRIYVSQRELFGTWMQNASLFCEAETVRGIVRSIENYGIFVELKPNLAGLAEYKDGVHVGQSCAVYIKSIIPDKMKVKLIIIDSHDAQGPKEAPEYFITPDLTAHIDRWIYSPAECKRTIETIF